MTKKKKSFFRTAKGEMKLWIKTIYGFSLSILFLIFALAVKDIAKDFFGATNNQIAFWSGMTILLLTVLGIVSSRQVRKRLKRR